MEKGNLKIELGGSQITIVNSRQRTANDHQSSEYCHLPPECCTLDAGRWTLDTARCTLQSAICNLPSAICHLPSAICIVDDQICELYGSLLEPYKVIRVMGGEENKNLRSVAWLTEQLLELGADRSTFLLGVGGGVVCDMVGFVASVYMRGCDFGLVPTTLLAQVDAAIGGKNGVNYKHFKNILGVIRPPRLVWIDPVFLNTLPEEEYISGLAEVVKVAVIHDAELFAFMERHVGEILRREPEALDFILTHAIRVKADIVSRDEMEKGERRVLNLGHTLGHALEYARNIRHGEAVAVGMVLAAQMAKDAGRMAKDDYQRIVALLKRLHLPVETTARPEELMTAIRKDKKRESEGIYWVMPLAIGHCVVEKIDILELEKLLGRVLEV